MWSEIGKPYLRTYLSTKSMDSKGTPSEHSEVILDILEYVKMYPSIVFILN